MKITHKALYQKLRNDSVISQMEQFAHYTLPATMARPIEIASSGRVVIERDFQAVGALLTNNLASKLARLLFPTQYTFFRCSASAPFRKRMTDEKGLTPEVLAGMFADLEREANERLFVNAGYAQLIQMLRYLIITGNALVFRDSKNGRILAYSPARFGVKRDGAGELLDCVLQEYTTVEALPWDVQEVLRSKDRHKYSRPEAEVEKYTRIQRVWQQGHLMYKVSEQVDTIPVGKDGMYPKELLPWFAPTWNLINGEDYGRGLIEDYAQDFAKLSELSASAALYGIEMMRVLHLVGAGSGGDVDDLATANSGEWRQGDPKMVQAYEAGDYQKLATVEASITTVIQRLSRAFMYAGNTRDAERVTRFELEQEAQEVEYVLGGTYSTLSGGVHVPLANILMYEVADESLAGILTGQLRPDVTAGIQALGRSADVQNLILASQEIAGVVANLQGDDRVDPALVANVIYGARSINTKTIFRSEAGLKAFREAKQAQAAAMAQAQQADMLKQGASALPQG